MNINNVKFITSVYDYLKMPRIENKQIAFAGKSNVGKSSLINSILNRKNFARQSSTPGKTASINIYDIDGTLTFCDLPGYGYAKKSKSLRKSWGNLMDSYFEGESPALVILIIDIRHDPTEDDLLMNDYLKRCGFEYIVVLSKADKISSAEAEKNKAEAEKKLGKKAIVFSAKTALGRQEITEELLRYI